jgi:hypothetical protein
VAFTDDPNCIESNGHTETANRWRETGKALEEAVKDVAAAMEGTVDKVVGDE